MNFLFHKKKSQSRLLSSLGFTFTLILFIFGLNAHAAQIVGADATDAYVSTTPPTQFGFDGLNLDNVTVHMVTAEGNTPIVGEFDPDSGTYPQMTLGDSYESSVFSTDDNKSDETTRLGYLKQKVWPISEPIGIKIVNNDTETVNGKPQNCIIGSSYLKYQVYDDDTSGSGLLNTTHAAGPKPVICSSGAGTSKRIQLVLNENVVADADGGEYGQHVDLVFNIASSAGEHRYQVFQKVTNYTGKRLDGFILEVLNSAGEPDDNLTLSLGIGEWLDEHGTTGDLFPEYEMAFYPPGLWGDGTKKHLPIGWFDHNPSGYYVSLENNNTMISGTRLVGNYIKLFGDWQPYKWVPLGMHEVIDPLEEPVLIAYWGTTPDETFYHAPAWHYGMYNNNEEFTDFATPPQEEFDKWAADPEKYVIDNIEDVPNVSLNYIVEVGDGIDNNIIIRIWPRVADDQTPPSYISKCDNVSYILPPQLEDNNPTCIAAIPAIVSYLLF